MIAGKMQVLWHLQPDCGEFQRHISGCIRYHVSRGFHINPYEFQPSAVRRAFMGGLSDLANASKAVREMLQSTHSPPN